MTGRVALITGASRGLGPVTAIHLAPRGAALIGTCRREDKEVEETRRLDRWSFGALRSW